MRFGTDPYGFNLTRNRCSLLDNRHRSYDHWCITDRHVLNHTRIFEPVTCIFSSEL